MLKATSARLILALSTVGAVALVAAKAHAHFYLQAPASSTMQDGDGNPQKAPPCGGNMPTGQVTTFQAGTTITITIDETIYHPGHYRVALAENDPSELPAAPIVTPDINSDCGTVPIMDPPVYPILADGELEHTAPFSGPQSFDVTLPSDVTCDNCTLQILEFMSDHGAPCFYYHCATIAIQEDPVMTTASSTGANMTTSGSSMGGTGGTTSGAGGEGGDPGNPETGEADSGCSCGLVGAPDDTWGAFALAGFVGLGVAARRRGADRQKTERRRRP